MQDRKSDEINIQLWRAYPSAIISPRPGPYTGFRRDGGHPFVSKPDGPFLRNATVSLCPGLGQETYSRLFLSTKSVALNDVSTVVDSVGKGQWEIRTVMVAAVLSGAVGMLVNQLHLARPIANKGVVGLVVSHCRCSCSFFHMEDKSSITFSIGVKRAVMSCLSNRSRFPEHSH